MAGHSKWANIRFRKGAQDKKRGKLFTKLNREITTAAREGGPDPDANPRLRLAIEKAKRNDMPKDNIEKAINKAVGGADGEQLESVRYEGYGPGGVAVMVDCLTDNRNRTVAEVRHAFSKCGGNLGTHGSVAYMFQQRGQIMVDNADDSLLETLIELDVEDFESEDDTLNITTQPNCFEAVLEALRQAGCAISYAEINWVADNQTPVAPEDDERIVKMLDMLEDLDDVQEVTSNAEFP